MPQVIRDIIIVICTAVSVYILSDNINKTAIELAISFFVLGGYIGSRVTNIMRDKELEQ